MPKSGAAAGFEAVMSGVLASDAKTPDGTTQQAPDGGAQGKPASAAAGTVAAAAKPESPKTVKDKAEEPAPTGSPDASGAVDAASAAGLAAAIAGVPAMAEATARPVAPQSGAPRIAVPIKGGAIKGGAVEGGEVAGSIQPAPAGTPAQAPVVPPLPVPAPTAPGMPPLGSPGQSSTQPAPISASASTTGRQPAGSRPTSPLAAGTPSPNTPPPISPSPASPLATGTPLPTSPPPASLEPGIKTTVAQSRESGTAVVLPAGKAATQQDPLRTLGQDTPAAPALGIPAVIQAGIPVPQPASTPQQAPAAAPAGMATPTPQADPAKLLRQVSGPLFSLAAAAPGAHVMTLKLSPEDLGPLTVRAHIDGAGVRIELFAPGEASREAVRSVLPELRRELGESGFGASLDLSDHNPPADTAAGGSDPRGSDPQNRRPAENPAFPRGSDGESGRLPRTVVVLPRSSISSLDILV
ncbi:flagellar hook-length control protein FliK [Arthrobacter bambusae]|uniref:flagellar hook-length control protein FliK n=1 Tax=Arthrobacter bambusae TaxID=1338426 RepID=UPI0027844073|nr:flagellar hook-length control protein FliK [Arthrobacter bambusae]MDQ0097095.1 flagellar hook-length control protein FliK [Arthrobacter bambusae]